MTGDVITRKRIAKVFLLFFVAFFFLSLRLVWIQFVQGSELQLQALDNRVREIPVDARRGTIYDRNMREMAVSVSTDNIVAFPPQVNSINRDLGRSEARETAEALAEILDIPVENIYERITRDQAFVYVARRVDFDQGTAIRELRRPGIRVVEQSQRFFPNDYLAAHVLGFAGIDNQGLEGIEVIYDEVLRGERGAIIIETDAQGREIPHAVHDYRSPIHGHSLVLTIDETIQFFVERELDILMNSPVNPKSATVVVMDPRTGGILALGNRPTFNPNNFADYPQENWRNVAVTNNYEPGSTFKVFTGAAFLEEGMIAQDQRHYCHGAVPVGGHRVRCWRWHNPHGAQSFSRGFQNSCNPVFINLALAMERDQRGTFYNYLKDFGFGRPTGVDLPGEATGIMIPQANLRPINIATISIGQGIAVTSIQLVAAMSAIANDGAFITPHIVSEIIDIDGNTVKRIEPEVVRQVISRETARETLNMLELSVTDGTGRNAYIRGYRVGGKTGTAQKAGPGGYMPGKFIASFLGVAPIDDPRLVVLVIVDEPQGYPHYGGTLAAPIFRRVVEDSLHYLGIPPQHNSEERAQREVQHVAVPELAGLSIERAERTLRNRGLIPDFRGIGTIVAGQYPEALAQMPPGTRVTIQLEQGADANAIRVPDLSGNRIHQATVLLEAMGLRIIPEGSGQAIAQYPEPGYLIAPGRIIRVTFRDEWAEVEQLIIDNEELTIDYLENNYDDTQ